MAQQSLSNDAVIKLVKAGLSDDLIVSTVNSQPGSYDTSPDALTALRKADVSDKVIAAMLARTSGSTNVNSTASAVSTTPQVGTTTPTAQPVTATPQPGYKPRVYIGSASKGPNRNAARDQSMEMGKDFEKDCPGVRLTISEQIADYTVLLNHIEAGLIVRDNQIQVANKEGDLISNTKEGGSIKGGAKKACETILADWAKK